MTSFTITRNRGPSGDDPYFWWNVALRNPEGTDPPLVNEQSARLHIPSGLQLAPAGFDPGTLKNVTPLFWADQNNPFKAPLTANFTALETQFLTVTYFVQSITNYKVDPSVRSRAFDSTANDVENYINWGEMAGDLTPAAPYTEAIAEGAKIALELGKGINDFLDRPDQPEVDCSGLLASEFISVNVGDLVNMLPKGQMNPTATLPVRRESYQETPAACSRHGCLSEAHVTFTIRPLLDDLIQEDLPSDWKVNPITKQPLTAWVGRFGETPDARSNAVDCQITLETPDAIFPMPRLRVKIYERYIKIYFVDLNRRVFNIVPRRVGVAVDMGNGTYFVPHADSAQVDSSVALFLYAARDKFNNIKEYRLKYERRDPLSGALQSEYMLVPSSKIF